jgi:hypothetical protein
MKQTDRAKDDSVVGDRSICGDGAAQLFIKPWSMWACSWRRTYIG